MFISIIQSILMHLKFVHLLVFTLYQKLLQKVFNLGLKPTKLVFDI